MTQVYEDVLVRGQLAKSDEARRIGTVTQAFDDAIGVLHAAKRRLPTAILEAADMISGSFARDGKLLIAGNGGSAAEAQHLAAEFVGRFKLVGRPGLPAIALGADTA